MGYLAFFRFWPSWRWATLISKSGTTSALRSLWECCLASTPRTTSEARLTREDVSASTARGADTTTTDDGAVVASSRLPTQATFAPRNEHRMGTHIMWTLHVQAILSLAERCAA